MADIGQEDAPFSGDFTGRGTWANNKVKLCNFIGKDFNGNGVRCLQYAKKNGRCKFHP